MQQLDDLAANGDPHHYKIDTALFLMLFHASDISDEHMGAAKDLRAKVGKKPDKGSSAEVLRSAFALLNNLRSTIAGPNYSAIYAHLASARVDLM